MAHVHDGAGELPTTIGRTFAIGIALNVGFMILEGLYGWRASRFLLGSNWAAFKRHSTQLRAMR